jgi:hypothetical protein
LFGAIGVFFKIKHYQLAKARAEIQKAHADNEKLKRALEQSRGMGSV